MPAVLKRALELHQSGNLVEAEACYVQALAQLPNHPQIWYSHGNVLQQLDRQEEAVASYDRALALAPDRPELLTNRSNSLHDLGRYEEALAGYDRALLQMPGLAMLHNNRGNTLREMQRRQEALASLDRALALDSGYVDARVNRGNVLQDLGHYEAALAEYDRILAGDPQHAAALNNRGNVLRELGRHAEAGDTVERLLQHHPDWPYAPGLLAQSRAACCAWSDHETLTRRVIESVRAGNRADQPFSFLALSDSAADQLQCARTYAADRYPPALQPLWQGERYRHDRIRVAYLSADFHNHATAHLMAELFERHDRQHFEVTGVSFGPDRQDEMRARLCQGLEHFIDVREMPDQEVAAYLHRNETDIVVDLKGFTLDCRAGILAHRPAPIQVNYLGYPGTMGAEYIDYVLADRHVIPPGHEVHYSERVVHLPDTYQVNDGKRRIAESGPDRRECGLPGSAFVFCCFNNNYKITPPVFDIWMRLLSRVEGSVLWLLEDNATAMSNLRREAARRGVDAERLIFAKRMPLDQHLARHRLADLFLDTLPYNAHTTASDALWAGLPVITCMGQTFAGRVAGSLLYAVGLPELVTGNPQDYEALALQLATHPEQLGMIRARLQEQRNRQPLFDCDLFRHHLESAYLTMWERYQRGMPPAGFAVERRTP